MYVYLQKKKQKYHVYLLHNASRDLNTLINTLSW